MLISFNEIRSQLISSGVVGLKHSVGWLVLWYVIPFANLVMPWKIFGALDRAIQYCLKYLRVGENWNKKGFKSFSWRALVMAILFIQSGAVAIFFNREIAKISRIKPDSDYSFTRMINATLEVQALNIISASIFLFFITVPDSFQNTNSINGFRRLFGLNRAII